ncbi:MAG: hypothetical protein N4A53_15000 [Pelagimonas sp.]|nr:hypothetical protein [Pelagimonas sp.]
MKGDVMFASVPDQRHRDAIRAAHVARGRLVAALWQRLVSRGE